MLWTEQAALSGHAPSMHKVGVYRMQQNNFTIAEFWLEKAAKVEYRDAIEDIVNLYNNYQIFEKAKKYSADL